MPNNGLGSLAPSSAIVTLTPAIPSATVTGLAQGIKNTGIKTGNIFEESLKAKILLKSIQQMIKALNSDFPNDENEFSGLDIFKNSLNNGDLGLFDSVDFTRQKFAYIPQFLSQAIALGASHGTQSSLDTTIGVGAVMSGESVRTPKDISLGSRLDEKAADNFFACCQHFSENVEPLTKAFQDKIKNQFEAKGYSSLESHESAAFSTGHTAFAVSAATPALIVSFLADTLGTVLRSLHASIIDTQQVSLNEEKVLKALAKSLHSMSAKPSNESCFETIDNLNDLIQALTDIDATERQMSDDLVIGTKPFSKTSSLVTIPFISTLISGLQLTVDSALGLILAKDAVQKHTDSLEPKDLSKQASSLEVKGRQRESSSAHSQNISALTNRFENINDALRIAIKRHDRLKSESDASSALTAGNISTLMASVVSALPILLTELGSITHETAAGVLFSNGSSDEIIKQSKVVSLSDEKIGEELDRLFSAAAEMGDALEMSERFGDSSPFMLGVTRSLVVGGAIGTLNLLAGAYSGIKEMKTAPQTLQALPARSELKLEEKEHARRYVAETKKSHRDSLGTFSTSAPKGITGDSALESLFNKIILTERISDTDAGEAKDRKEINSVGKASIGAENSIATSATHSAEFLTGGLFAVSLALLESGVAVETIVRTLGNALIQSGASSAELIRQSTELLKQSTDLLRTATESKEVSEGPDKIKVSENSHTNFSFISNALRLSAENQSKGSGELQSTAISTASTLESIFSRTLTIFLMHSGILHEAINELTKQNLGPEEKSKSVRRTKASAKEEVLSKLANIIEQRLNQLEEKPIPGLNNDMALAMQSFSQQRIVSALSSEMTIVEPFLVLGGVLTGASERKHHKEEALTGSEVSKQISRVSNLIQGFTIACIDEAKYSGYNPDRNDQSLLKTHHESKNSLKSTLNTSGYSTLTLVETVSALVGRSFTLLDSKKISNKSDDFYEHSKDELKINLDLSTAEVKADSRIGEKSSAIHSISALRSTLTHFSAALKQCADELVAEVKKTAGDNVVLNGLEMHSSQAELMRIAATAFSTCASLITRSLALSSGLSFMHIISLGQVDKVHEFSHQYDETLNLKQNDSSQTSTKGSTSDALLVTGLTSDLVASTITNLIKILLKASLLGSDVLMSVSKVLEILVVDVHPEKRLKHEMERLSLPMVGPTGSTKTLFQMLQALKLISTISTGQACVTHNDELLQSFLESSFQSLQNKVNVEIESLNILEDGESKQEVEDEKESKINLRGLIRQIMNALSPGVARDTCNSLMDRYNMGGITLSSYHQKHGGLLNTSEEKTYVRHYTFKYIDDVRGLIDKFIDEMYESYLTYLNGRGEDPLLKFNEALGTSLTPKAKELHRYLIEGIAHKLAEKYNITRASLFHSPRISFNSEGFLEQYSISNGIKPTEMKEGQTQIEARLSEVNESRRLREENRRRQPQESGHRIR